jgi:hypothetical protein
MMLQLAQVISPHHQVHRAAATCLARLACPVAPDYRYAPGQMRFHMVAFMQARGVDPAQFD